MKLEELAKNKKTPDGTYVGVKFNKETVDRIKKFIKLNNIPNPIKSESFHCTVIYSRKYLPTFKPKGKIDPAWIGKVKKLDIFKSQSGTNCLVIIFKCPELTARHKQIMKDYDATYDFDEYHCHITISYDCGKFDPSSIEDLESVIGDIIIDDEYSEDLNLNWAEKQTDKSE